MAELTEADKSPVGLSQRFDRYRAEVEQIVTRGIEHPNYELKRSATISRDSLAGRLDFVKLIQGLANAHIAEERFIVVGADQKERKFCNIGNADEFDPANLTQVLSKYLDPQPRFEAFNNIWAEGGESYVLIVLSPDQPRPIVAVSEGTSEKPQKRTHFRLGDIWVKKDTSLQLASRADLDAMYERHINEEAEDRARRRFKHFREELGPVLATQQATSTPSRELLVGDRKDLRSFAEFTISAGDIARFKMLLEMALDRLVEKWDSHHVNDPEPPTNVDSWIAKIGEFYRDGFIPALESAVELGLQIIKYDAPREWLGLIVDALIETFETCRRLDRLQSGLMATNLKAMPFARPAYEVYIGVRTLATYAVLRKRYHFLSGILPRFVRFFTVDNLSQVYTPLTFWPFSETLGLPNVREGRNRVLWNERVQSAWARYFGTAEKFLAAASQLEFVLEFNSYLLVAVQHPEIKKLGHELGNKRFDYLPDFWVSRLNATVQIAERFYDALAGQGLPPEFAIEQQAMDLVFKGKGPQDRLLVLGLHPKNETGS